MTSEFGPMVLECTDVFYSRDERTGRGVGDVRVVFIVHFYNSSSNINPEVI